MMNPKFTRPRRTITRLCGSSAIVRKFRGIPRPIPDGVFQFPIDVEPVAVCPAADEQSDQKREAQREFDHHATSPPAAECVPVVPELLACGRGSVERCGFV